MSEQTRHAIRRWWQKYKDAVIVCVLSVLFVVVVVQFLYPRDRMLPFAYIDGVHVAGWEKKDVIWELNKRYEMQPINIYIGENDEPFASVAPAEVGLTISNDKRINEYKYPWYMRLIPSSILWYERVTSGPATPATKHTEQKAEAYIKTHMGSACNVKPVNATVKVKNGALIVVEAQDGGTCEPEDAVKKLQAVAPKSLTAQTVRIPVKPIAPRVTTDDATSFSDVLQRQVQDGVSIRVGNETQKFDKKTLTNWLSISMKKNKLVAVVSSKKARSKLEETIGKRVYKSAGITHVTTKDFTEISRSEGAKGKQLDIEATVDNLTQFIQGKNDTPSSIVTTIQPTVNYTRTYSKSDVGISALMQQYAKDHKGTYGVQLIELSGQKRRASYNAGTQFTTASTYKLFVAYSTLKKVEAGKLKWSQQINGGRDLATCFDDMIVKSDNACAEALIEKISHATLQGDVNSLGLTNTTFSHATMNGSAYATTASDLATFLAALQTNSTSLSSSSRDRLISAMKRNIYRQGIPAGTSATVANKVGFLAAILNDAGIVYSPKGTYVLVVMSDGASWGNIAELTKEIEKLR